MFDAVIDLPDSRQIIDDAPTTEDIFREDDLFFDKDIEDDSKQIIDHSDHKILITVKFFCNINQQQQQLKIIRKFKFQRYFAIKKKKEKIAATCRDRSYPQKV